MHVITQAALGMAVALAGLTGTSLSSEAAGSVVAHQEGALGAASCRRPSRTGAMGYQGCSTCRTEPGEPGRESDGRTGEVFVITPDRTVVHSWKAVGGWKEMPGHGRADSPLGLNSTGGPRRCVVVHVVDPGYPEGQSRFSDDPRHDWTARSGAQA